jgi:arabinan endo-1,5-alpha-L-arabinosidase
MSVRRLSTVSIVAAAAVAVLVFSAVSADAATYPNPGPVTGNIGVHDPSVVKTSGGTYVVASTGDNLALKTSTDRTAFAGAGTVWPNGAPWTAQYTGGSRNLWAPDISFHNGQYYLYYAASTFGSNTSAIFLATSATGTSGSWTDRGLVISTNSSSNFNAIDPNLLIDAQNQSWLVFGSFWSGIKEVRINASTGKRSTTDTAIRSLAARPDSAGNAIEAPFVYRHGSLYYLFVSFDRCCQGAQSTYRIMVGRSSSPNGPFVDRSGTAMTAGGGTEVLAGHDHIHGPGSEAVFADTDGDVLMYHYYADDGSAKLGINLLGWDSSNWPFVH